MRQFSSFLSHSLLPSPSSKPPARASGTHGNLSEDLFPFSIVSVPAARRAAGLLGSTAQLCPAQERAALPRSCCRGQRQSPHSPSPQLRAEEASKQLTLAPSQGRFFWCFFLEQRDSAPFFLKFYFKFFFFFQSNERSGWKPQAESSVF